MSDRERRRSSGNIQILESSPLIISEVTPNSGDDEQDLEPEDEKDESKFHYFNCSRSQTTVIGLLLLLSMMSLTVLSAVLRRFSENTYVNIIVPVNDTSDTPALVT